MLPEPTAYRDLHLDQVGGELPLDRVRLSGSLSLDGGLRRLLDPLRRGMGQSLEFFAPVRFSRLQLLPPRPDIGTELNDLDQRIATRYETDQEFAEARDRRRNATIQQGEHGGTSGNENGATNQSHSSNPTKGASERTPAAAPFGVWQVRFTGFKAPEGQVGRFEEAEPCVKNGSNCHRAWSGARVALV
jgi:hypothetical protein